MLVPLLVSAQPCHGSLSYGTASCHCSLSKNKYHVLFQCCFGEVITASIVSRGVGGIPSPPSPSLQWSRY